jgi:hypothetical protein
MNKIILISLVIFFAICSKSWAGEIDGKGIICGEVNTYKQGLYFEEGSVALHYFHLEKDKIEANTEVVYYEYSTTDIFWEILYQDYKSMPIENTSLRGSYMLDRKTLILYFKKLNSEKVIKTQCGEILQGVNAFMNKIYQLKSDYQKRLDTVLKDNKI